MGGQLTAGSATANAVCGTPSPYRQFGSSNADFSYGVAVDGSGNVFVAGVTGNEAFVKKFDPTGIVLWSKQFMAGSGTTAFAIAADGSGNSYVTGYTAGTLADSSAGAVDAFVRKYNASGGEVWTHQFGTSSSDYGRGIAVDTSGNVYLVGQTGGTLADTSAGNNDVFIRKYNSSGTHQWTHQFGTSSSDDGAAIVMNGTTTAYVASTIGGDAELRTYSSSGSVGWTRTVSTTSGENARGLAVTGSGDAYITGYTTGALTGTNAGSSDVYLRKYLANGDTSWTRQFGTTASDYGTSLGADGSGNVYVAGYTSGALTGTNAGGSDVFVRKYGPTGSITWTQQFGTSGNDETTGVAVDGEENTYTTGHTFGTFVGTSFGSWDGFVGQIAAQ